MAHHPVLLRETINLLAPKPGSFIVDATLGDGGHAKGLLKQLLPNHLLGIDVDIANIEQAEKNPELAGRMILVNDNFVHLKDILRKNDFYPVSGILFDLGWSRTQFEKSGRGFSFQKDEPLDMRMGMSGDLTAEKILNKWPEEEIGRILREYGEEKEWRKIAKAIIQSRKNKTIKNTNDLIQIIENCKLKIKNYRLHPATKVFQALRIAVNDELDVLKKTLPQAIECLTPGGRLAVISFHSLEDRIVKQFFVSQANQTLKIITKKPLIASREEIKSNPSSRSAKLRVAEKI